ncbi:MAG: PAS domain S-box protein [Candidatus Desulforudis sp.]|nr:PAS domain S-box protein [Desulforudis sp.]
MFCPPENGTFSELVDLDALQRLQDDFTEVTGLATSILDPDGQVLNHSSANDVCERFHRRSPLGRSRCRESHRRLLDAAVEKRDEIVQVCDNGLASVAIPLRLAGRYLATLVVSQAFFLPLDEGRFRAQARELGLEQEPYLVALRGLRVMPVERFLKMARLLANVVSLLSDLGQRNLEQRILDEQLQRERAHLSAIFQGSGDGMRIIGTDYRIVQQNREMELLSGVPGHRAVGRKCFQTFHHPYCGSENCVLQRILAGEQRLELEVEKVRPDGRRIDVDAIATPLKDASGRIVGVIESFRDITERKRMEEALRASKDALRVVFNSVYDAIFLFELDGAIIDVNEKMLEMYGVEREQALNLSFAEDYSGSDNPVESLPEIWDKAAAGEDQLFEWRARRPNDGSIFDAEVFLRKLSLDGKAVILATVRDITESKQNRLALQRANEELEATNEEMTAVNEELISAEEELKDQVQKLETSREALESANRRLLDIIDFLPDATFVIDRERKVIAWNRAIEVMSGVSKEDIFGKGDYAYAVPFYGKPGPTLIDLVGADDPETEKRYEYVHRKGQTVYAEVFVPSLREGRGAFLWVKASPLYDRHGNLAGAIESIRDITEQRRAREELNLQKAYFQQLFENSPEGIVMLDKEDRIMRANKGFQELFQYGPEEVVGRPINEILAPEEMAEEAFLLSRSVLDGRVVQKESVRRRKDGTLVDVSILGYPIVLGNQLVGIYGIYSDITERKRVQDRLKYLSLHDPLTGLFNRAYFEQEMQRLAGGRHTPVGVILCDVDGLKMINDTLGHDEGDTLLRKAADVVRESFRVGDVVARVGGDEFAVLLPASDRQSVEGAVQRMRDAIEFYNSRNPGLPLSISVGFAVSGDERANLVELFKEADNNMYREKLHRSRSARSAIVHTLMKALEARDFITEGHAERLQKLVVAMAAVLDLPERRIIDLRLLAQFHDIGKVGIPDRILFKSGPLTPEERVEMQRHCEIGHRIALSAPDLIPIADWILKHHEWWNGRGYPLGLRGEEIPLECRILAIADAYDAMTSDRPYRKAWTREQAIAELRQYAGLQFDPELTSKFLRILENEVTSKPATSTPLVP